jgi:type IV pilus assembly protein PilV
MSLVEVLVSTVIFVIGVLGLLSAHASAFNSFTDAKLRIDAALLADRLIGELWVDRAHMAEYAYGGNSGTAPARIAPWLAQLQQSLPAADASVEVVGEEVRVTVTWQPRDGDRRTHVAVTTLQGP